MSGFLEEMRRMIMVAKRGPNYKNKMKELQQKKTED